MMLWQSVLPAESRVIPVPLAQLNTRRLRTALAGTKRSEISYSTAMATLLNELREAADPTQVIPPIRVVESAGGTYIVVDGLFRTVTYLEYAHQTHQDLMVCALPAVVLDVTDDALTDEYLAALSVYYNQKTRRTYYEEADLKKLAQRILPDHPEWQNLFGMEVIRKLPLWGLTLPRLTPVAERAKTVAADAPALLQQAQALAQHAPPEKDPSSSSDSVEEAPAPVTGEPSATTPVLDLQAVLAAGEKPNSAMGRSMRGRVGMEYRRYMQVLYDAFTKGVAFGPLPTRRDVELCENLIYAATKYLKKVREENPHLAARGGSHAAVYHAEDRPPSP